MSRDIYHQDYGSHPNHYATYAAPGRRPRKLDSRGASRGTGSSEPPRTNGHPTYKVAFLGSQLMGKEEPDPEEILELIARLTRNLVDDNFRPRGYTLKVTDSEIIICETAAEWTERVPLRVIHYCMQGDQPHTRAFGFVASARQGFMGHVFMAKNTADAKELKKSFYYGFEKAYQKYRDGRQDRGTPPVRDVRPEPPIRRAPFVESPYGAPSYNAYYGHYPNAHPAGAYPAGAHPTGAHPAGAHPQYRVGPQSMDARQAAAAANGQPYATRYYMKPGAQYQQPYRGGRPTDSFLHEYQQPADPHTTRGRATRSASGDRYRSVDQRARAHRSQTPEPFGRAIRRERPLVSDDMVY